MSHVTTAEISITDLPALINAVLEFGGVFKKQSTYRWWGRSVGDYPIPKGMTVEQLGKCDFAISIPESGYDIGVVKQKDGTYLLAYDFYGTGRGLLNKFGEGLGRLTQAYNRHALLGAAQRKGYQVRHIKHTNGTEQLVVTVGR